MAGFLLHAGAVVLCAHGGQATPAFSIPRVLVGGEPIVLQSSSFVIAGCQSVNRVSSPCITAQFISAATRIKSNGQPVLLADSQAICIQNGTPLIIGASQTRVKGI